MINDKPQAYILCGLPGSGKTTYSKKLEDKGVIRFSVDESMLDRFGKYGIDFPEDKYGEYKKRVLASLEQDIINQIERGNSVVLDFGLWQQKDRIKFRKLVENAGAKSKLIYFKAEPELLIKRLESRNQQQASDLPKVSTEMFNGVVERFEEPKEDETPKIIEQK